MKRLMLLTLAVAACSGSGQDMAETDSTATDAPMPAALELAMPDVPSASRGQIALRSAGELDLVGEWRSRAGWCVDPPMLQVLLEEEYDGAIILLALPRQRAERVARYPVVTLSDGIPEGPASQAAVQRIIEGRPYAWQAEEGEVDLYAWDGDRVSGRFTLTMRNIATNEQSLMAGAFLGVEALELGREQCQPQGAPAN